jgi:hypothetical protein
MESFICYWLNELLRIENWEEINTLNPYLACFTFALRLQDSLFKDSVFKILKNMIKDPYRNKV